MDENWDVIVVGGGAAGLAAALMLGRARRSTVVIDAGSPRNRFAAHMHGTLGMEGLDPEDLLRRGRSEVATYGVNVRSGTVTQADADADGVRVELADGAVLTARALVVTTGLVDELPAVEGLQRRWGRSVLHCPYCHGWEVRDARLGVILTSPLGVHQAQLVRQWSSDLTVFVADEQNLDARTAERLASRGVRVVREEVVALLGEGDDLTGVRTASGDIVDIDAVFIAATTRPSDAFLAGIELRRATTPMGEFVEVDATGRTSHPRIWAAGNVTNPGANVPMSIGAGTLVGAAVNAALVEEDFDAADAGRPDFRDAVS